MTFSGNYRGGEVWQMRMDVEAKNFVSQGHIHAATLLPRYFILLKRLHPRYAG